jgi:predicted enzyme related to lactoylglutathione lyase
MPNPICHFEICVKDLKKGAEFYKKVFGWEIKIEPEMNYCTIATGSEPGGGLNLAQGEMKPYVTIYPKVDDISAVLKKAKKNGAFIICEKAKISDEFGYYGMFADPDGNVIGVWSKD